MKPIVRVKCETYYIMCCVKWFFFKKYKSYFKNEYGKSFKDESRWGRPIKTFLEIRLSAKHESVNPVEKLKRNVRNIPHCFYRRLVVQVTANKHVKARVFADGRFFITLEFSKEKSHNLPNQVEGNNRIIRRTVFPGLF